MAVDFEHAVGEGAPVDAAGRSDRLVRAVRDLAGARELADVVEIVRHAARELAAADGATFVLRDGSQCHYVDEDAIEPLWRGQRFPLEACISGWAMLNAESVFIPDIYLDDRIPHDAYRPTFVKSLAMTPVRSDDPIAAIGVYWAVRHRPTSAEIALLQALADSTAVALENVRILAELEDRVAERTAELEAANADLAAYAHLAAHDLQSPLATVAGCVEIIQRESGDALMPRSGRALDILDRQARRMSGLVEAILDYATSGTVDVPNDRVDLGALTDRVLADLAGLIEQQAAVVEVRGTLPCVTGSAPLLERVVQNLVANAIAHGPETGARVTVDARRAVDHVELRVSDNGPGVDPRDRERIFEMFTRGSEPQSAPGAGIGLAFVRRVVERHHGAVTVEDAPGGGARFVVSLPAAP